MTVPETVSAESENVPEIKADSSVSTPERAEQNSGAADTDPEPVSETDVCPEEAPEDAPAEDAGEPGLCAEDAPAETDVDESDLCLDDLDVGDAEPETETPKKKRSVLAIVLTTVIGLLLIAVVCLAITVTTLSKTGDMPGFITAISERLHKASFDADAVAISLQDADGNEIAALTNAELGYYFWGEYYYYVQNNGFSFDASKPLADQPYSEDMTWQDFFLDNARSSIQQIAALKAAATAANFVMPEEFQSEYDTTISSMADYAVQAGFTDKDGNGDVLAYIRDSYGDSATEESFAAYLYDSYYVTAYSDMIFDSFSFTDDEVETYFDANSDMLATYGVEKSEFPNVNVRHILIQPAKVEASEDSAEDAAAEEAVWADAEAEAQKIYEEWKSGDATEESFAELANTHSTDPGSNTNGGLYENVHPGQMVPEFNDWCFDAARKPGDSSIVKTSYGYHIMYYVAATEEYYWRTTAENELRYQEYDAKIGEIVDQYSPVTTDKLAILQPDAVTAIQADAAAAAG